MMESVNTCNSGLFPIPYGCYCGPSDDDVSFDPVDAFDAACLVHDNCYREAPEHGCRDQWDSWVKGYAFTVRDKEITCPADQSECLRFICGCDKAVVEALVAESVNASCPDLFKPKKCPGKKESTAGKTITNVLGSLFR